MAAPKTIIELVEHFDRNPAYFLSNQYNETELRREFLDPLFEALGWDVNNKAHIYESYKDVVHEPSRETEQGVPDYCFRIGGTPKFYVEAKKPSVHLKDNPDPALQIRRYGWSSKLPLSLLSNFAELAVYDTRIVPKQGDKASVARVAYYSYKDFAEKWDEIAGRFSKEALLKGSFDQFVQSSKLKKGTAEVDSAFLTEIENWRHDLATNIASRNPRLTQREINFAVQRTIDRIIFLRICEDRGLEPYGQLRDLLQGAGVYQRLCELFKLADARYNSGLFHFHAEKDRAEAPDDITPRLYVDDARLKSILKRLYYPESPYAFSHVPAEILGQVYEQFLGQVIRITPGHQAKVEPKPEVKKAGGVYYTPTYIVDYIVHNTVGKLLEGKTPKQIAKIRILDPACGSGSFLIGAYQFLLNWYLDAYTNGGKPRNEDKERIYRDAVGNWRLTLAEKKQILLRHIFGVDIDTQAVEVTKLSLLLKVLEGETQLKLFHERALPDLGNNIKCGNSLIGPGFYENQQMFLLDEDDRYRINVFDWKGKEGFGAIMKDGGFDAVIGNPPYGATFSDPELAYLVDRFAQARKFPDSYCLFMLQAWRLAAPSGYVSFIVPNTFCDLENCDDFRRDLMEFFGLQSIWQSGWAFETAIVDTLVFVGRNEQIKPQASISIAVDGSKYERSVQSFLGNELSKIDYRNTETDRCLLKRVSKQTPLGQICSVKAGVKMYEKGKGTPPQTQRIMVERPFSTDGKCPPGWQTLYRGEDVGRYSLARPKEYVKYGPWLAAPRSPALFESPKILMRRTDDRLMAALENRDAICVNSCHVIKLLDADDLSVSYPYLVGLLNSRLMQHIFEHQNPQMVGKVFAEIKVIYVERLPIRLLNPDRASDMATKSKLAALVERMCRLVGQFGSARTDHEHTVIQRQIEATDRQIDKLVYELYDLTNEEIAIVEGASAAERKAQAAAQ